MPFSAQLQWDCERKAFEVHRFLQHYEHPTLHPVTGPTWALKASCPTERMQRAPEGTLSSTAGSDNLAQKAHARECLLALQDWARAIVGEGVERVAQPLPCAAANFLVDLVVLHSLLESRGSTVALK